MRRLSILILLTLSLFNCGGVGDDLAIYKISGRSIDDSYSLGEVSIETLPYSTSYKNLNNDIFSNKNISPRKVLYDKASNRFFSEIKYRAPSVFLVLPPVGRYPKSANLPIFFIKFSKCEEKWILYFTESHKLEYRQVLGANFLEYNEKKLFSGSLQKLDKGFGWSVDLVIAPSVAKEKLQCK